MFFVCKRRWDEMEARRAGETTEPSSEGAMWCVPGARFFMPGGYAICLGVTRDSNLSISSATASRWLLWSFSTRPQLEQEQKLKQAQLWPFCICWLLQLPSGHGNRAKGQSPTPTIPAPTPIAAYGRQQAANQLSTWIAATRSNWWLVQRATCTHLSPFASHLFSHCRQFRFKW